MRARQWITEAVIPADSAIYRRATNLKEKYGFDIEVVEDPTVNKTIQDADKVGITDYDVAVFRADEAAPLAFSGIFVDLTSVEHLNLDTGCRGINYRLIICKQSGNEVKNSKPLLRLYEEKRQKTVKKGFRKQKQVNRRYHYLERVSHTLWKSSNYSFRQAVTKRIMLTRPLNTFCNPP